MKIFKFLLVGILFQINLSCDNDFLELKPKNILLEDQVWNDESMIKSLLANYYNRLPTNYSLYENERYFAELDEAVAVNSPESGMNLDDNNIISYSYDRWTLWNYSLIRDINLAIEGIRDYSKELTSVKKDSYYAEFRFLRAFCYFELVKRMGGVPIIEEQLIYDYNGDPSYLAKPRSKEEEVYDFIASECDEIKDIIGNGESLTRANKYSVLALKSRAMLYAASICKYNNLMESPITLPGAEVGISADKANGYYKAALEAAKEVIASNNFALYRNDADPRENFYQAIVTKSNNPEVILAMDFNIVKKHNFSYHQICRTMREDNLSSSGISPSLNLVEAYEYLDGTPGTLHGLGDGSNTAGGQVNWIFYDNPADIFANKDARLYGTIIYPGTSFKGVNANIQAGVYVWNNSVNKYDRIESSTLGSKYTDGETLTGLGGPVRSGSEVSNTGFYLRKYIDPEPMSSARGIGSAVWWIKFRYAEILLNAAEAAFELGGENMEDAVRYVNELRERAGFPPNSLNASTLTIDRIRNERRVEFAFEDHRLWDVKRWRVAHKLWDGTSTNRDANIYALYCYRIVHPGSPNHGKYVFDKFVAPNFKTPRFFQLGNYYSRIGQTILDNNSLIVKNPFH
ncbi:MAG: RagB/SusD family nutrient uptake outer membrane protein [Prolixibacteraceae bacterium]